LIVKVLAVVGRNAVNEVTYCAIPFTGPITIRAPPNSYNVQKQEVLTVSALLILEA